MSIINQSVTYPNTTNLMPSPYSPALWYGSVLDNDLSYSVDTSQNPSGKASVGLFEYVGVSGTATLVIPSNSNNFLAGDKIYASCMLGLNQYKHVRHLLQEYPGGAVIGDFRYNFVDDVVGLNTANVSYKRTIINSEWCIVETEFVAPTDGIYKVGIWLDPLVGAMPAGDKIKAQAAFFGKANDFPALVTNGRETTSNEVSASIRSTIRNTNTF